MFRRHVTLMELTKSCPASESFVKIASVTVTLSTVNGFPVPYSMWVKFDQHVMPRDMA
jgi:hypothetical protein